jgi:hypothetical protein
MLITISLLATVAGLTGAASLTKFVCEVLGTSSNLKPCSKVAGACSSSRASEEPSHTIPKGQGTDPQLVRGLLDDAEIKLRVLRREMPGPRRRSAAHIQ